MVTQVFEGLADRRPSTESLGFMFSSSYSFTFSKTKSDTTAVDDVHCDACRSGGFELEATGHGVSDVCRCFTSACYTTCKVHCP